MMIIYQMNHHIIRLLSQIVAEKFMFLFLYMYAFCILTDRRTDKIFMKDVKRKNETSISFLIMG